MALSETLKALSDPVRRRILQLLKEGSKTSGEIAGEFEITPAAISRHLTVLKQAGLIRSYRDGQHIINELNASILDEVMLWITDLRKEEANEQTEKVDTALHHS